MKLLFLPLLALLAAATPVNAILCDEFSEFDGTNPGDELRWGALDGPAFTLFTDKSGCAIAGTLCLHSGSEPALGVYKTLGGAFKDGTVLVPADALIFHPGPKSSAAVIFTAPTSATYRFTGSAFVADTDPSGVFIIALLHPGGANFAADNLGKINAIDRSLAFSQTIFLTKGDTFGFAVDNAGSYLNDSTGVRLMYGAVPEPASWAMLIAGFGAAGAAQRRERQRSIKGMK